MLVLYVVSVEQSTGKTAICAGLGKSLMSDGKKVGYLKPSEEGSSSGGDIASIKQVLGLSDEADMSNGRDVVLMEGMLGSSSGDDLSQKTYSAAREMNAKVIVVEAYSEQISKYAEVYKGFGDNLLGIIINKTPVTQVKQVRDEASAKFGAMGINTLGVIAENRTLLSVTVGELAESIQGKMLNNTEKTAELVENFMLGAMVVDSGLDYFGRKNNKAAIVRQDRPDMQLAALETSTKCLVLTGSNEPPLYNVLQKAENRGIPIITTEASAENIIESIESMLSQTRFNQEKKLSKLAEVMKENLDLSAVV